MTLPLVTLKSLADRDAESTSIFQTSDMDRYIARPQTSKFIDMCLAEFVSNFKPVYKRVLYNDDKSDDDDDDAKDTKLKFKLLDEKGSITQRKKPCVIRYMRVSMIKDAERHFSNQVRLFLPHRGTNVKPAEYHTYQSYYMSGRITTATGSMSVKDVVKQNITKYEHNADTIDEAWQQIQDDGISPEAWAEVAPNAEELRRDDEQRPVPAAEVEEDDPLPDLTEGLPAADMSTSSARSVEQTRGMKREEATQLMQSMNKEQRQIFSDLTKWCSEKAAGDEIKPFRIFLTGGAGTGNILYF